MSDTTRVPAASKDEIPTPTLCSCGHKRYEHPRGNLCDKCRCPRFHEEKAGRK